MRAPRSFFSPWLWDGAWPVSSDLESIVKPSRPTEWESSETLLEGLFQSLEHALLGTRHRAHA